MATGAHVGQGAVHGTYVIDHRKPDSALSLRLTGAGTFQGTDHVKVTGALMMQRTGATAPIAAGGSLTLASTKGRVVLRLEPAAQGQGASTSGAVAFVVQSAAGQYRQLTGSGLVDLTLAPAPTPAQFTLTIEPAPVVPTGTPGQPPQPAPQPPPPPVPQPPPPPMTASGISGTAVEGPITPVERLGVPNTRPLPGAIITIQPAGGGPELARVQADAQGNFQLNLDPGTYEIVPLAPQPGAIFPRGITQEITVLPDQVLKVVVNYDTGLR
jgi:hypothetical protein